MDINMSMNTKMNVGMTCLRVEDLNGLIASQFIVRQKICRFVALNLKVFIKFVALNDKFGSIQLIGLL
jgi:hypothetical protein